MSTTFAAVVPAHAGLILVAAGMNQAPWRRPRARGADPPVRLASLVRR